MKYPFPKSARLRFRRQYQRLSPPSVRHTGCWMILDVSPNQLPNTRLGITATRHFGKAHDRNRFKRIVREAFRLCLEQLPKGLDVVVKPRSQARYASSVDIQLELVRCLKNKANL